MIDVTHQWNLYVDRKYQQWGRKTVMSDDKVIELMAEGAHDAWWEAYKKWGYTSRKAEWGEEFMVPFSQLSERGKDLDRVIMKGIMVALSKNGLTVAPVPPQSLAQAVFEAEGRAIRAALKECDGHVAKAAVKLGVPGRTFRRKLKLHGLDREARKASSGS